MSRTVVLRTLARAITVVAVAWAAWIAVRAPHDLDADEAEAAGPPIGAWTALRVRADSVAGAIIRRNPFRIHRTAAVIRFDPTPGPVPDQPPPPPRPPLVLTGVVLGADPAALIEGLPGADGSRLLRAGDRHGDYQLRAIGADSVVITAADTTFVLRARPRP